MARARSASRPSRCAPTSTPMSASSRVMVRTSMSAGTLLSSSGASVSSVAHRIGSAAFFAPETRTSPSSGRPPVMRSLSTAAPLLGGEGFHRQCVNFLAHALPPRLVNELVALHAAPAGEKVRHDQRLEMLAVADHLQVLARQPRRNALLHAFDRDHVS